MINYTESEEKDINERVEKAMKVLEELDLKCSAQVVLYLQDTKYTPKNEETNNLKE